MLPLLSRRFLHQTRTVFTTAALPSKCLSCSQPLPSALPACNKCWTIQRIPSTLSHHQLLGLNSDRPFDIDTNGLKQKFRRAQMVCHPDAWQSKGADKHEIAESLSAQVNQAYKTLLSPLARTEYILEQQGHALAEEDQLDDMELMGEVMMAREAIEEDDLAEVEEIRKENNDKIEETMRNIRESIEAHDWASVKHAAVRLKYLDGVEEAARTRLE